MTTPEKLEIRTPDGVADAWAYRPSGAGPSPAILYLPDAFGVRPASHQMCERLASLGYFVLQPNVLFRAGDFAPFDIATTFSDPAARARIMGMMQQIDTVRDTLAYLDAIARQPGALAGKVGCVGYCLGGRMAFVAAGNHPERIAAVASIHGGNLVSDKENSPHAKAAELRARVYLAVADEDGSCTPEHQGILASSLGAAHVAYQIELYPGARHGFAVPDFPVYDAAAAERHWQRLATFFGESLPRGA